VIHAYTSHLTKKDYKVLQVYDCRECRQLIRVVERAVLLEMPLQKAVDEEKAYGEVQSGDDAEPVNLLSL